MIRVEYALDPEGSPYRLRICGHSGYADAGEDIVCAGVSALGQTAALALEEYGVHACINERDADLIIALPDDLPAEYMRDALLIMRVTLKGLCAIAQQYPRFILIKEVHT